VSETAVFVKNHLYKGKKKEKIKKREKVVAFFSLA